MVAPNKPELVGRDSDGAPIFGAGKLKGWVIDVAEASERERTLRNAFLAALQAESEGDTRKAYQIWTYALSDGTLVWQAVQAAMAHHVASLLGGEADYTLSPAAVGEMIERTVEAVGCRPSLKTSGYTDSHGREIKTMVWEWPETTTWLGVEVSPDRMARHMTTRPNWAKGSTAPINHKLGTDCADPHKEQGLPGPLPHDLAECDGPTIAEAIGDTIPDHPNPYARDPEAIAPGATYPPKLVEFLRAVDLGKVRKQRKSKTYYPCLVHVHANLLALCREGNGDTNGMVDAGDDYVSVTGRSRAHPGCARKAGQVLSESGAAL